MKEKRKAREPSDNTISLSSTENHSEIPTKKHWGFWALSVSDQANQDCFSER